MKTHRIEQIGLGTIGAEGPGAGDGSLLVIYKPCGNHPNQVSGEDLALAMEHIAASAPANGAGAEPNYLSALALHYFFEWDVGFESPARSAPPIEQFEKRLWCVEDSEARNHPGRVVDGVPPGAEVGFARPICVRGQGS